ncbi:MAG: transposase, partial [Thermodesulfovibrionales bacterium]
MYLPCEEMLFDRERAIGADLGIRHQVTFSNGVSIRYSVPITDRLRRLYQQFSRTKKDSKNRSRIRLKIQKEFYRLTNTKTDIKNKIVSYLKRHYQIVCYQDDDIETWQRIWGSKILSTSIGGIKDMLKGRISTPVEVERGYPSTYLCLCGSMNIISLNEEVYRCKDCGLTMHRDVKAAI